MKTTEQTANFFGCTAEQIRNQYAENYKQLSGMLEKARITGRKVNGFTAEKLGEYIKIFKEKSGI